ncbi:MAG: polysaccharide deacetylase family protein [Thermodesulfobacteriota bacterium]
MKRIRIDLRRFTSIGCFILIFAFMGGCATFRGKLPEAESIQPGVSKVEAPLMERTSANFIAVIAREGDTLSAFASKYLNDPSMDWFIAEFNDMETLTPGQTLIIPLKPYQKGGLTSKGYQTVPVLSYHHFSLDRADKLIVTKSTFEEQMKFLKERGYRVITLGQLFDFLEFKSQIPKKSVVINIDDGWRSAYDIAFPILKKYGYPVTLFVYTDLITGSEKTLSWDLIEEMAKNGVDIQCHTKTHRRLTTMDQKESFKQYFEAIEKELSTCEAMIKKKMGKEIRYLAYPYGDTNPLVIELLKKHGYWGAFTVKRGGNPFFIHNYRLNRSMIYGDFDLNQFEKNLTVFTEESLK